MRDNSTPTMVNADSRSGMPISTPFKDAKSPQKVRALLRHIGVELELADRAGGWPRQTAGLRVSAWQQRNTVT